MIFLSSCEKGAIFVIIFKDERGILLKHVEHLRKIFIISSFPLKHEPGGGAQFCFKITQAHKTTLGDFIVLMFPGKLS